MGFAAIALGCVFDGIHFYGEPGLGAVGVIYSAVVLPCQQSGIHYYVSYLPAAWGIPTHSTAQPSLSSVGEIIRMCQLFHRAETW